MGDTGALTVRVMWPQRIPEPNDILVENWLLFRIRQRLRELGMDYPKDNRGLAKDLIDILVEKYLRPEYIMNTSTGWEIEACDGQGVTSYNGPP